MLWLVLMFIYVVNVLACDCDVGKACCEGDVCCSSDDIDDDTYKCESNKGSICHIEDKNHCIHGTYTSRCVCDPPYYGQMCEYDSLCSPSTIKTSQGCLAVSVCSGEATEPCLCGDNIITDGYCVNSVYYEKCAPGAKNCYDGENVCTYYGEDSCVDSLVWGCSDPDYEEYDASVGVTLSTCKTRDTFVSGGTSVACTSNSDCTNQGCYNDYCADVSCSTGFWNGTQCEFYSECEAGYGGTHTPYADVVCELCPDNTWTNVNVCSEYSDMTNCEGYWEHGDNATDRTCIPLKTCQKSKESTFIQEGDFCILCEGYSERNSETNKEECIAFQQCGSDEYAVRNTNADVTCISRVDCGDLEELQTDSPYADSFCFNTTLPQCVKDGLNDPYVDANSKRDLFTMGMVSKENARIAFQCPEYTEFKDVFGFTVTVKKSKIETPGLYIYAFDTEVGDVHPPNGLPASCTAFPLFGESQTCFDDFITGIGCLHGDVNGSTCECETGVWGDRCDQIEPCTMCDNGMCEGDIFSCTCYEHAIDPYCVDENNCDDCGYGTCEDGNNTYTCTCHDYGVLRIDESTCDYNCEHCDHCESCDKRTGPVCSASWSGDKCDTCTPGHEKITGCQECEAGKYDGDEDAETPCESCPEGWFSHNRQTACVELGCVHSSSSDTTGCVCLDGWSGDRCDKCQEGTEVALSGGSGICKDNTYICAAGRSGENCELCDGFLCSGTMLEKIKAVINSDVQDDPERVSRSKAWDKVLSIEVARQRKKDLMAQLLIDGPVTVSNADRDTYEICKMSVRGDCATTKKNLKLVAVKSFSDKSSSNCDVTISDFTIVFGLVAVGDQMTVCDANGILFHQKLINEDSNTYEFSLHNGRYYDFPVRMSEHDSFYRAGISFTVANLEAVADPCIENDCEYYQQCVPDGDDFQCVLPCATNPCEHGSCENADGGFTCDCADTGYNGDRCENNIDNCVDCLNGGECTDGVNSFTCDCTGTGFEVNTTTGLCSVNIQDCESDSCNSQGTCTDGINSFTCACGPGFQGTYCGSETIECPTSCMNGGTCTEKHLDFECDCGQSGFEVNTTTGLCTVDKDDCVDCQNDGVCTDGINSFTCDCTETEYNEGSSGLCTVPKDPCANVNCVHGACSDGECDCSNTGYANDAQTGKCTVNINYCETNPCVNGHCMDGQLGYTCDCYPGWDTDGSGHCTVNPDDCIGKVCDHGRCVDSNGTHVCECLNGFTTAHDGHSCRCGIGKGYNSTSETCEPCAFPDYNLEYTAESPCEDFLCEPGQGYVATGWNASEETHCETCPTGYASPYGNTVCENVNECLNNPCGVNGKCTDLPGTYECECDVDYDGDQCYSINHCDDNPCNNGECRNGASQATCICLEGWEGDTCISSEDDCFTDACNGHGECIDKHMDYECSCVSGFDGNRCQNDICALITDPTEYINNQCCSC